MGKPRFGADPDDIARWNERERRREHRPKPSLKGGLRRLGLRWDKTPRGLAISGERDGCRVSGLLGRERWQVEARHPKARHELARIEPLLSPRMRALLERGARVDRGGVRWEGSPADVRLIYEITDLASLLALPDFKLVRRLRKRLALPQLCELDPDEGLRAMGLGPERGVLHGCEVTIRRGSRWTLEARHPGARKDVVVSAEIGIVRALWEGADLAVGDPSFDNAVRIGGPEPWLRAALDRAARDEVRALIAGGAEVREGAARWASATARDLASLPALARLGERLSLHPSQVPGRLRAICADDDEPLAVRRGAARALCGLEPDAIEDLAEPLLLGLLDDTALRLRALAVLERTGTSAAVPAILAVATGLFVEAALKEAGRRAIAAIEGRQQSGRGRLAVSAEGGELSEATGEGGLSEI